VVWMELGVCGVPQCMFIVRSVMMSIASSAVFLITSLKLL
jgi:hypothetical protein